MKSTEVSPKEKSLPASSRKARQKETPHTNILTNNSKLNKDFFKSLYGENKGFIEARLLNDSMDQVEDQLFFDDINDLINWNPPKDNNIRLSLYTKKAKTGKSAAAQDTAAIYADYDINDLEEIKKRIHEANIPEPSIIVNSGHGFHVYWLLYNLAGREAEPVLRAVANRTGADIKQAGLQAGIRPPGTYNLKDEPVKCEIIEINKNKSYQLEFLASNLGVRPEARPVKELVANVERPCMKSLMSGVKSGQRNFALGRITKYLQQKGKTRSEAKQLILKWNYRNEPPENENKLIRDFNSYWKKDYKLLGCRLKNEKLQQDLSVHCNRYNCPVGGKIDSIELNNSVGYNNRLLQDLRKVSGAALLVYGVLSIYREGLNTDQLEQRSNLSDNVRTRSVKELEKLGYINIRKGNARRGIKDFYKLKQQGTFNTGRTIVSKGAISGAVHRNITLKHFKLYVLLIKYALGKDTSYPNLTTLGKELGVDKSTVSRHIKKLEKAGYIKIDRDYQSSAIVKNRYILQV